ncbi:MAG: hypothetical protein D6742_13955, partial [Cyanobacteria bacterium J069]
MPIPRLRDFLEPALLVSVDEPLIALLTHCQQVAADGAIALNRQGAPLGRLRMSRVLALLYTDLSVDSAAMDSAAIAQGAINRATMLEISLADLVLDHPSLLQPVTVLPADWDVAEGWHWLHASPPPWVLVNDAGQVLGQVDAIAFWRHFAALPMQAEGHIEAQASADAGALAPPADWQIAVGTVTSIAGLDQSSEQASAALSGSGLVGLVERLPVPMMLWTADGEAIAHSLGWQQQIGDESQVLDAIAAMETAAVAQAEVRLPPSCRLGESAAARSPQM